MNIDLNEINKFSDLAGQWWNIEGPLRTLHQINPLRLEFILKQTPLLNQKVLDIGCGAGILSESLGLEGGIVTGIDMSAAAIDGALLHQKETDKRHKVNLTYELIPAEEMAKRAPESFDVVTCMEMLEHVPEPASIVLACATLLKPGGYAFFSTLNRNLKSYLFAIIGAEYILNLLPKKTHDYEKFIKPSELTAWASEVGLKVCGIAGIHYDVFGKTFSLVDDVSVNYMICFQK